MVGVSNVSSPYRSADALGAVLAPHTNESARMEILVGYFGFPGDTESVTGSVCVFGLPPAWEHPTNRVWLTVEIAPFNSTLNASELAAPVVLHNGTWALGAGAFQRTQTDALASVCENATHTGLHISIRARWRVRVQDVLRFVVTHTGAQH